MGYSRAGFEVVGVDIKPQKHYPFEFHQADALEFLSEHGREFDAIHASPPCQGYSIMNNLPWLKGRDYPLLILPVIEMLEAIGKPYVLENVMGARHGAKGLSKRGLGAHGLKAGWLCGTMFGLPFYRHRLFASNWFWMQPGHPIHRLNLHPRKERYVYGGTVKGLPGGSAGLDIKPRHNNPVNGAQPGGNFERWRASGDPMAALMGKMATLGKWQNGSEGVGVGHAKGWRLAAEVMGIDWMSRAELTQAIPPVYTEYIGKELMNHPIRVVESNEVKG